LVPATFILRSSKKEDPSGVQVHLIWVVGLVSLIAASGGDRRAPAQGPYAKIAEIPIGGPLPASWDYLTADSAARRLHVSHGTEVVVIDIDTNAVVGRITDTPGVHGIAILPTLNRGFTTNGRENKVSIVDLKTLQTLDTAPRSPTMALDPRTHKIYLAAATVPPPDPNAPPPVAGQRGRGPAADPNSFRVLVFGLAK
jgi:hypothetical protein